MANDLIITQSSNLTAVPLQNITLSVAPSSNFGATSYLYQWKLGGSNILGQTADVYKFDAPSSAGETTYTCAVSGLTGLNSFVYAETTNPGTILKVVVDNSIFTRHLPKGANPLNETGRERFLRLRNLGYC